MENNNITYNGEKKLFIIFVVLLIFWVVRQMQRIQNDPNTTADSAPLWDVETLMWRAWSTAPDDSFKKFDQNNVER